MNLEKISSVKSELERVRSLRVAKQELRQKQERLRNLPHTPSNINERNELWNEIEKLKDSIRSLQAV